MEKTIHRQDYKTLLRLLREAREAADLTQEQLAERLDETQSWVSKVERGERRLDVIELRMFCEALALSFTDFIRHLDEEIRGDGEHQP